MKTCSKCQQPKTLDEMVKNKAQKSGYASYCKKCAYVIYCEYRARNPEKAKQVITKYRKSEKGLEAEKNIRTIRYEKAKVVGFENYRCNMCFDTDPENFYHYVKYECRACRIKRASESQRKRASK